MSAIFGIVRFDGQPVSSRDLDRMGTILAHRGPDGQRTTIDGAAGLGHCLLRVNREDWSEAQPIQDGELTVVADLRLDNREALAERVGIASDALRDMPDSEVLLAAYRHWGEACVDHLLGDFAFAIWDSVARTLMLARDHMGQRGIYYHHAGGFLAFASEVRALWAVEGVPRRLSEVGIGKRILIPIEPNPGETIYDRIALLPGGNLVRLGSDGTVYRRIYWQPHAAPEHCGHDEAYYLDAYRAVIEEAVACRVRRLARAPALFFSGGFDSGTIAALAGPIVDAAGRRVVAISSVAKNGGGRVRSARSAVEAFRPYPFLDLHFYERGQETTFTDMEESFAIGHFSGTPYVRRGMFKMAQASGVRLVLDGHGGDYTVNVNAAAMLGRLLRRRKFGRFVHEFKMRIRATGRTWQQVVRHDVLPALLPLGVMRTLSLLRDGFETTWRKGAANGIFARAMFDSRAIDPRLLRDPRLVRFRWNALWLHMLRKASAQEPSQATLAGAHGLDFSRPFHDPRIVELGLAVPAELQFRNGLERYLARHVFADILPPTLLARGPGNDPEDPDFLTMAMNSAPAAFAEARRLDHDGRLSRYIDFDRVEAMSGIGNPGKPVDQARLYMAIRTIALARFIAWFDPANR